MSSRGRTVVVVGSGPSGLAAALMAARRVGGGRVRLIDDREVTALELTLPIHRQLLPDCAESFSQYRCS